MLLLHERTRHDGSIERTFLERLTGDEEGLALRVEGERPRVLPIEVLVAVMNRYGRALDPALTIAPDAERIVLADRTEVVHFRHLARYDVIARDWIGLIEPDAEPIAELATAVNAALRHLLDAMGSGRPPQGNST
jgi:hypothetical protein